MIQCLQFDSETGDADDNDTAYAQGDDGGG